MLICGIDEAGRGPWAGPVVAAAVVLPPAGAPEGVGDSKALTAKARARLEAEILRTCRVGVGLASPAEIDALNIRRANHLAMARAYEALGLACALARVDGNDAPPLPCAVETLIGGDARDPAIGAASIIAKEHRDRLMIAYCEQFPGYGFSRHKGYGAAAHAEALARLGPCPIHRMSFKPVRAAAAR